MADVGGRCEPDGGFVEAMGRAADAVDRMGDSATRAADAFRRAGEAMASVGTRAAPVLREAHIEGSIYPNGDATGADIAPFFAWLKRHRLGGL